MASVRTYVHSGQFSLKAEPRVLMLTGSSPAAGLSTPFPIRISLSGMGVIPIAFATVCPDGSPRRHARRRLRCGSEDGLAATDGGRVDRGFTTDVSMR